MANQSVSSAKSKRAAVRGGADACHEPSSPRWQPVLAQEDQITALESNLQTLLATDVSWQTMMNRITTKIPAGITLTSFSGQVTPPVPVVGAPSRPRPLELGVG